MIKKNLLTTSLVLCASVACLGIFLIKLSCRFIGRGEQSFEDEEPPEICNGASPDAMQLEWFKKYKDKETRTLSAFKSLMFFALFMLVLGIVCYGSRDYYHYLMAEEVKAIFPRAEQVSKVYSKCLRDLFSVVSISCTLIGSDWSDINFVLILF